MTDLLIEEAADAPIPAPAGASMTDKRWRPKAESEQAKRHRLIMESRATVPRCAFCPNWTHPGYPKGVRYPWITAADAQRASLEHRRAVHPDRVVYKRPKLETAAQRERRLKAERTQAAREAEARDAVRTADRAVRTANRRARERRDRPGRPTLLTPALIERAKTAVIEGAARGDRVATCIRPLLEGTGFSSETHLQRALKRAWREEGWALPVVAPRPRAPRPSRAGRRPTGRPRGVKRRITDEQVRALHAEYLAGANMTALFDERYERMGYSSPRSFEQAFYVAARSLGLPRRPAQGPRARPRRDHVIVQRTRLTPEVVEAAERLYVDAGLSLGQIAFLVWERLEFASLVSCASYFAKRLRRNGVQLRPTNEAQRRVQIPAVGRGEALERLEAAIENRPPRACVLCQRAEHDPLPPPGQRE